MISAAELRALQSSRVVVAKHDEEKNKAMFSARFKKACDAYYNTIMEEVKLALESIQEQESSYTYLILNYKPLIADFEGLKYTTLLYGYWNAERKEFDDSTFAEYDVEKPFEKAKKELAELGYRLENVSDPSISKRLFIKFSWGEEEKPRKPRAPRVQRENRERFSGDSYVDRRRYAFDEEFEQRQIRREQETARERKERRG